MTKRLVDMAERPPLFHDRITPAVIMRRLDRVLSWLGTGGRIMVTDYIRRREVPQPGKAQWSRWDRARLRERNDRRTLARELDKVRAGLNGTFKTGDLVAPIEEAERAT